MNVTAYSIAERFIGIAEVPGSKDNPHVLAMLRLDNEWPESDEVPWCSGFTNYVCWLLRLPRSKSLLARSWLGVGTPVELEHAVQGFDVVILKRGRGVQPGPENQTAPGHVGLFSALTGSGEYREVHILGGNQGDSVSVAPYRASRVLGVRRLYQAS